MIWHYPLYTHTLSVLKHIKNIQCPPVNTEEVLIQLRTRGRKRILKSAGVMILTSLCLFLLLNIIMQDNCDTVTSMMAHEVQPPVVRSCDPDLTVIDINEFFTYTTSIQDFLYYHHCRDFPMLLNVPNKCNIPEGSGETVLLMAIKSLPKNYAERAVLRKTWATERRYNGVLIRTVFLTGTSGMGFKKQRLNKLLHLENKKYQDILQWDFSDAFYNLTLKQILFMDWLQNWCPTADFIFNGDDDVFVNTDNLVVLLQDQGDKDGSNHLCTGHVIFDSTVVRNQSSKYYIPEYIEKAEYYTPYCSGAGYLYSRFTARVIHQMSQQIPLMPIDDVYIGMCLSLAGLESTEHPLFVAEGFVIPSDKLDVFDPCHYREIILDHNISPHQIFLLWNEIHRIDLKCAKKEDML